MNAGVGTAPWSAGDVEQVPAGIARLDRDGRWLHWNRQLETMLGTRAELLAGHTLQERVLPECRAALAGALRSAGVGAGGSTQVDLRVRRDDGNTVCLSVRSAALDANPGQDAVLIAVFEDIDARSVREQALRDEAARWLGALELGGQGGWDWNMQTRKVVLSQRWKEILGYGEHELESEYGEWDGRVHPDDRGRVRDALERHWHGELPYFECEYRLRDRHGDYHWVRDRGQVVARADDGRPQRMLGTHSDVTERKRLERGLVLARQAAESESDAKSDILSALSRELRTPLNAILGFAQLLAADTLRPLRPDQQDSLQEILAAGGHLLELVNEVVELARIESGKMKLDIQAVTVEHVICESEAAVEAVARQRGVSITRVPPVAPPPPARADAARLRQALSNLLATAVKCGREGGVLTVSCERAAGTIVIEVRDDGPGLTVEQRHRLFHPFERPEGAAVSGRGTGIGLVLARRLIELMGGDIEARSIPGESTCYRLRVPVVADNVVVATIAPASDTAAWAPGEAIEVDLADTRMRIVLYVEDNPANMRLLERALANRRGMRLITAATPALGLALAMTKRPDLILLDVNLPDMNGFEVLAKLREDPLTSAIPVVAISANAMPADLERGRAAGFEDYLTKPISLRGLARVLDRFLT
ncbi:MAG: PAS domain-containing protein [Gammaproteobacteria bacterium]|nr:PAS domain-containing protein [Gammaproteobacteria bacterium]